MADPIEYFDVVAEPCADILDAASALEHQERQNQIKRAMEATKPQTHPDFDGTHCTALDCGVEIPAGRLALGKIRCVDCQARLDRLGNQYRR